MSTVYQLGTITGLRFSARLSAFIGALLLWILLSGVGIGLLTLSPAAAIVGALVCVVSGIGRKANWLWRAVVTWSLRARDPRPRVHVACGTSRPCDEAHHRTQFGTRSPNLA